MDLSINNINLNKKNIAFKGMEGAFSAKSVPVFKFYAPAHNKDEKVALEIAVLYKNNETAQYNAPDKYDIEEFEFQNDVLEIPQSDVRELSSGFAYRYKITNTKTNETRYQIDPFRSIDVDENGKMNVIEQGRSYGISPKAGTMRHSFLDSDVRFDEATGKRAALNKEFARNHFNKLGGSIKGLNWLLTKTDELDPYRYFMTTPDIGADKVSSHRYWPANQYQCSDLDVFKEFNFELFQRGKGYVADGAFTSQGIQSPLVQHVLKWGEKSPFYEMLKIDGKITLGILPDIDEHGDIDPYEHIGVRLVNPKGEGYDKNKPTYIQFYDDRLLKPASQIDGKLHFDYDNSPKDIYEITSHQDSVQPYAFEIDPNDKKIKAFGGRRAILLSEISKKQGGVEDFLSFSNFNIGSKNKVAGVTCWDGNVDIIKMNLSNPSNAPENRAGFFAAREYLFGVASYWTETVQSHLILQTAKLAGNKKEIEKIATANEISQDQLKAVLDSVDDGSFESPVLSKNYSTSDLVEAFPLQTLETSDELSAIFAQPQFAKEFFKPEIVDKISTIFDKTISNIIASDNLTDDYKAYVEKVYKNEILTYIYVSALKPEAIKEDGTIDKAKLKEVTLKSLETFSSLSPEEERKQVIGKIKKGLSQVNLSSFEKRAKKELKSISLEDFKKAEALVLQGKGGLNWRFDAAKDIGDLDAVRNQTKTFDQVWNGDARTPGVQKFWTDFVSRIKEYNPSAYIINEVTSLGDFCDDKNDNSMLNFDRQLYNAWVAKGKPNSYEDKPIYAKQVQFLNETSSTTTSEYSKGFNSFSMFAGVNPEKSYGILEYDDARIKSGDLSELKGHMERLMQFNQPNSAIYSHMFVSNHDKPSVLHTMPLNMSLYMGKNLSDPETLKQVFDSFDTQDKGILKFLLGEKHNMTGVSEKALAVAMAMTKAIRKLPSDKFDNDSKKKMLLELKNLVYGKANENSAPSFKRSEAFGVKPFEITIKDLIEKAKIVELPENPSEKDIEKYNEQVLDKTREFHHTMMKDSMGFYESLWEVMNACVGTPTLFGGNEFVQTGYETPSKNVYLGIRNEVLHDLKEDSRYSNYYDRMHKISNMYRLPGLSVLRDGTPISLKLTSDRIAYDTTFENEHMEEFYQAAEARGVHRGAMQYYVKQIKNSGKKYGLKPDAYKINNDHNNHANYEKVKDLLPAAVDEAKTKNAELRKADQFNEIWPIYRKNAKGEEAVSIITNIGLPRGVASWEGPAKETSREVPSILIVDDNNRCPFEDGTQLVKVDYENNKEAGYIVQDGKIVKMDKSNIELKDTVSVFIPKK
ncbi:MAG: hypothetical protein IJB79_03695 [Candidatus Gastranaerophilales bacterium]|nr:hypothetical protein [Candidatus Gastranaerophilales bacterium]